MAKSILLLIQLKENSLDCVSGESNGFFYFFYGTKLLWFIHSFAQASFLIVTVSLVRVVVHGPLIFKYLPVIKVIGQTQ